MVYKQNFFDESTDLSTSYLSKTDIKREYVIKAEEKFPILGQGYISGKLMDNFSNCYHVESVERLCKEFNTIVNERKEEEKEIEKDKYPWLDENNE